MKNHDRQTRRDELLSQAAYEARRAGKHESFREFYNIHMNAQRKRRSLNITKGICYVAGTFFLVGGCGYSCRHSYSDIEWYNRDLRDASYKIQNFVDKRDYFKELGVEIPASLDSSAVLLKQRADSMVQTPEYRRALENSSAATRSGFATAGIGAGLMIATGIAGHFIRRRIDKNEEKEIETLSKI